MKSSYWIIAALLLAGCVTAVSTPPVAKQKKTHAYCKTHAREFVGEADEEGRFRGCILILGRHEVVVEEELP